MRRSRFLLLTLLPAYGLLSLPAAGMIPEAAHVLMSSNIAALFIPLSLSLFRVDTPIVMAAWAVSNMAFWLPVAHLADRLLQRRRRA